MTGPAVKPAGLSSGEYLTLVVVLAAALVGTAIFVSWLAETRGILAPDSTPRPWDASRASHPSNGLTDDDSAHHDN